MNLVDGQLPVAFYVMMLWSLFWKAIALWRAAKGDQKIWYIVMLVLNTAGILEIIYLFRFAKKRLTFGEIQSWLSSDSKKKK